MQLFLFIHLFSAFYLTRENCDFNEDDIQAVGKVYVFDLPLTEDPISTVTGETELEQLGFDNVIIGENDDNILLVSAPTAGKKMQFLHFSKKYRIF